MKIFSKISILLILAIVACKAQQATTGNNSMTSYSASSTYWQQQVDYKMNVDMNVNNYQYTGTQKLVYTNNSPDVLDKVYYHLYFNAFQPGSEMDVRSRTIADPSPKIGSRISKLSDSEIGYLKVISLTQNGQKIAYSTEGTILEVTLAKPIQPGTSATFDMNFEGQVPVQIRRSGRNNKEGVALSMAQWYPKLAEYDFEGWHTPPYIAREFHGVWGDFDVKITIDKNYVIGGTGYLQNPNEIGHGYETGTVKRPEGNTLTWHFNAPNVHDFTWAADPDFIHDTYKGENDVTLHFLYKNDPSIKENWKKLQPKTADMLSYYNKYIGQYPYKQYSVIQGGDGGMEYAMCTLITGKRKFGSLVGVTAHELAHTWFQFLLATNESKHEWMDEGFTSYISHRFMNENMGTKKDNPHKGSYSSYFRLIKSGREQPLTTHADRYDYNRAYGVSAYSKGEIFLAQLEYIIGKENVEKTLKKYFTDFKFKHPTPNDIKRTAEKVSGIHLDWYLTDWAQTTNTVDYGVKEIQGNTVVLERIGRMPMPIDLTVNYADGSSENFYIPLRMMREEKPTKATQKADWAWAYPYYALKTSKTIKSVEIDPSQLMADINRENNVARK
ncbi:M1 family metallopeptidase [Kordia sp. YSTF-M3]|uniref:M1 family metallopeptidase n=1 Tax=Kordia aestuariivivens TaxID=2759037 RepID=A0ABR7QEE6_9FLAO|nr:M1 family metallopeptidase [Kordia aestuariivivens]MBC8756944.1 M1 family metallopeptidase [Kordia aestuariivivens]